MPRIGHRDFARLTIATGCTANRETPLRSTPGEAPVPTKRRLLSGQRNLPTPQQFAREDLVAIDSKWFGPWDPGAELSTHNPGVRLPTYVIVVNYPPKLGERVDWADRHATLAEPDE